MNDTAEQLVENQRKDAERIATEEKMRARALRHQLAMQQSSPEEVEQVKPTTLRVVYKTHRGIEPVQPSKTIVEQIAEVEAEIVENNRRILNAVVEETNEKFGASSSRLRNFED